MVFSDWLLAFEHKATIDYSNQDWAKGANRPSAEARADRRPLGAALVFLRLLQDLVSAASRARTVPSIAGRDASRMAVG